MFLKLTAISIVATGCAISVLGIAGAHEAPHREVGLTAGEASIAAAALATHVPAPRSCAEQTWPYITADCVAAPAGKVAARAEQTWPYITADCVAAPAGKVAAPRAVRTIAIR